VRPPSSVLDRVVESRLRDQVILDEINGLKRAVIRGTSEPFVFGYHAARKMGKQSANSERTCITGFRAWPAERAVEL
jgi:hypothetical protein